jgi:hypothetical protein
MADDMAADHGRPWDFPLEEIVIKVFFWFCELDKSVPPAMGWYLSSMILGCEVKFVSDAGHLWILLNVDEVLNSISLVNEEGMKLARLYPCQAAE